MTRVITASGWLLLTALLVHPAAAQEITTPLQDGVPKVTSHSIEYCNKLANRIDALLVEAPMAPPSEVGELASEGQRMCAHGQMRGGIMRLRKALVLLREGSADR